MADVDFEKATDSTSDNVSFGSGAENYPTIQEVDQTDIPHHHAADPANINENEDRELEDQQA